MARPTQFDRESALDKATKLFWTQGYHATSLSMLLERMGIARSSFYASFVDKRSLFIECLQRFGQRTVAEIPADNDDAPLSVIPRFFQATLLDVEAEQLQKGCMLVNSVLELANTDPTLSELSAAQLSVVQNIFEQALSAAAKQGKFTSTLTPSEIAEQLMIINQGLRVQSRKGIDNKQLWASFLTSLKLLGLEQAANFSTP
ncbi:TetR/AcrR family transcriptional regulator [Spongiibacter marinus]|uniref:TetR/AcrR family transcriptional regulator n=1 Tax=Spongiibacter marinus TaxID=354246 RepID=UPI0003FDA988|nr:TetR/AcrR family transcriptional regulator [Spongiibacter marinus]